MRRSSGLGVSSIGFDWTATSSGSRGVYGAISTGEWGLKKGCAVAYTDKGTGAALTEGVLAQALDDGLIADATIAANDVQASDFWRIRESISDSERALGPASQHDISVPVEAMRASTSPAAMATSKSLPSKPGMILGSFRSSR
mgnify:CR=1 FL=1